MAQFDMGSEAEALSPNDLQMINQTLEVWCMQHGISRKEAKNEAKVLVETFLQGKRSQIELIDALVKLQH